MVVVLHLRELPQNGDFPQDVKQLPAALLQVLTVYIFYYHFSPQFQVVAFSNRALISLMEDLHRDVVGKYLGPDLRQAQDFADGLRGLALGFERLLLGFFQVLPLRDVLHTSRIFVTNN